MSIRPDVERTGDIWCRVSGLFHRAVNPAFQADALDGSRVAGRYSGPSQRTLYLSSSPEGVEAAMTTRPPAHSTDLVMLSFRVAAEAIIDLRNPDTVEAAGIDLTDAIAPWSDIVRAGGEPASWRVRRRLESLGANGLIDPSRQRPGLWHLTLFRWNCPNGPSVGLEGPTESQ